MPNRIRVCHVINSLSHGGAEHLLVDLANAVTDVEISVVALGGDDDLVPALQDAGANVKLLNEKVRFDPRTILRLRKFLLRKPVDVVHTHLPYAQTVGRVAGYMAKSRPLVSTHHNVPSNYHQVTRLTERSTRSLEDATIAVSQGVEVAHTGTAHEPNKFGDQWCTIYNGIDVEGFSRRVEAADGVELRNNLGCEPTDTIYLNVGRYVPDKSQEVLIEGFSRSNSTDTTLIIVGDGPRKDMLRDKVKKLGVDDQVRVTGAVPEIPPYYAAADVFVSASRVEGMPITILEAMATGIPVIATDISGVDEVVEDGTTGVLYPHRDANRLSELFDAFLEPDRRDSLGRAGYERVRSRFDIRTMARAYEELYRRLLSGTEPA